MADISAVVAAVAPKPVNVLVGSDFTTVAELAAAGVRRISVGGALARAAWTGFIAAATEIAEQGTFTGLAAACRSPRSMTDSAAPDPLDEPGTTLTVDELILRPWRPSDAPALYDACQDPEIARWVTIPQPYLMADAVAFIDASRTMWRDGTGAPFAIVDADTDRLLGAVTRFGPDGHQATFGLWLTSRPGVGVSVRGPSAWRRTGRWRRRQAFRLDAYIMVGNEASYPDDGTCRFPTRGHPPRLGPPPRRRSGGLRRLLSPSF